MKFIGLMLIFITTGCIGSGTMSPDSVKDIAAPELDCPKEKITLKEVNNRWYANGCGKKATFVCSGSTFMSKGTCLREGNH